MYARITPYQLKPGTLEAATAKVEKMKSEIMALPGMLSWTNAVSEEGRGYIVAILSDRETSEANADKVRALWGQMAEFLTEMPVPQGYAHVVHWDK